MRDAVLKLMNVLAEGGDADDDCADQLSAIAVEALAGGDKLVAAGMAALARHHRVRALELRRKLAAVSAKYGGVFHQGL